MPVSSLEVDSGAHNGTELREPGRPGCVEIVRRPPLGLIGGIPLDLVHAVEADLDVAGPGDDEEPGLVAPGDMLEALVVSARAQRHAALSLSVEPDNPARRLYERCGFQVVGAVDGSLTMLLFL